MVVIILLGFLLSTFLLFSYCFYAFLISFLPTYKKKSSENTGTEDTPNLYLMIPCANEEKVIGDTLSSILKVVPANTIIYVIDDASEDKTAKIVKKYKNRNVHLFRRFKPNAQKGKGEALNCCFQKILKDVNKKGLAPEDVVVGVFDADVLIDEKFFPEIFSNFVDKKVGQVQSRVRMIKTKTLLQKMQDYEFMLSITAIQNAREYSNSVCMGGNGQFMRLSSLLALGNRPWGTCLLEDFEIGLRLLLLGHKSKFANKAIVKQQALKSLKRFIRQRSRWVQGNIQANYYLKNIIKSKINLLTKIDLVYFILQSWTNLLGIFLQAIFLVYLLIHFPIYLDGIRSYSYEQELLNILMLVVVSYVPSLAMLVWRMKHCGEKQSLKEDLKCCLLMPIYNILSFPSVLIAFYRQLTRKNDWLKTSRNV